MADEHNNWLRALEFYKSELKNLKERLTEIAGKYTSKEVGAEIEHFENQMKVQVENIDTLHHEINNDLAKIADQAKENAAGYVDVTLIDMLNGCKDKFLATEKVINDLRHDFNRFASEWM